MLRVFILCAENVLTHDEDVSDAYCTATYEGRRQRAWPGLSLSAVLVKYIMYSWDLLRMGYSFLHNHIILLYCLLLACLPTIHIPLSELLLESRCSASLSCVCVYMGVLLHMEYVCVCE